jgi:hypothetical protein
VTEHELVRAELVRQHAAACRTLRRGVVLIALVPVALVSGLLGALIFPPGAGPVLALLGALAYTAVGSIAGFAKLAGGTVEYRRAGKQLREHDRVRQLPQARVVVR